MIKNELNLPSSIGLSKIIPIVILLILFISLSLYLAVGIRLTKVNVAYCCAMVKLLELQNLGLVLKSH